MTTKQKIALIKRLYRPYTKDRNYNVLARRFEISRATVRYYLEKGYRERCIKNQINWQKKNKDRHNQYINERNYQIRLGIYKKI